MKGKYPHKISNRIAVLVVYESVGIVIWPISKSQLMGSCRLYRLYVKHGTQATHYQVARPSWGLEKKSKVLAIIFHVLLMLNTRSDTSLLVTFLSSPTSRVWHSGLEFQPDSQELTDWVSLCPIVCDWWWSGGVQSRPGWWWRATGPAWCCSGWKCQNIVSLWCSNCQVQPSPDTTEITLRESQRPCVVVTTQGSPVTASPDWRKYPDRSQHSDNNNYNQVFVTRK